MKLIIGLGNPREEYVDTRHNAGFLVADQLQKTKLPAGVVVRRSDVFMNESGSFVKSLVDKYHLDLSGLYIIHDDLDIPLGAYKIQFEVGPKVHNGVNSVETELGTKEFWRVRVGVDNRKPDDRIRGEDYVLQNFTDEERETLNGVIEKICKEISNLDSL
jgi:peptidyl-tRNA hydrolase, PTH1 family